MSTAIETMKVMPWSDDHGPFVIINKADFNPAVHKPYRPKQSKPKPEDQAVNAAGDSGEHAQAADSGSPEETAVDPAPAPAGG